MSSVAPDDARDLDDSVFDDTVERPPRLVAPVSELSDDLEDTIDVRRPPELLPVQLVDPARALPPAPAPAVPDVRDNIWAQPVPEPPRPFRIRLADGTLVPLDQPVYLGRKPSVPRIHPGGTPLLVTLDSPQREVSSTHLELTTVGGAIVASDAKSTNGSVVRVPGAAPRTLHGGESAVVTPGTVIELGDGNRIELLAPDPDAASPDPSGARP